jgi:hypothetical protein
MLVVLMQSNRHQNAWAGARTGADLKKTLKPELLLSNHYLARDCRRVGDSREAIG